MPAAKSRKAFPSTSSTIEPWPFLATSGYSRENDGDMNFASYSITFFACGPGNSIRSRGNFVSVAVIILLSSFLVQTSGQRLLWRGFRRAGSAYAGSDFAAPDREERT